MKFSGALLNVMLAGTFLILGARWYQEGATGWFAFAILATAMNLVLAFLKFRDGKRERENP